MTDVLLLVIYYAITSLLSTETSHVNSEHTGGAAARSAWGPLGRPQRCQPCPPRAQSSWRGRTEQHPHPRRRKGRWTVFLSASFPPFCRSNAPAHCGWDNHFIQRSSRPLQRRRPLAKQQITATRGWLSSNLLGKAVTTRKDSPEREMACPATVSHSTSTN